MPVLQAPLYWNTPYVCNHSHQIQLTNWDCIIEVQVRNVKKWSNPHPCTQANLFIETASIEDCQLFQRFITFPCSPKTDFSFLKVKVISFCWCSLRQMICFQFSLKQTYVFGIFHNILLYSMTYKFNSYKLFLKCCSFCHSFFLFARTPPVLLHSSILKITCKTGRITPAKASSLINNVK